MPKELGAACQLQPSLASRCSFHSARAPVLPLATCCPLAQVLHLDIAPSNIVLSPEGRCLLLDFHLAQLDMHDAEDDGFGQVPFKSLSRLRGGLATPSGERCWPSWVGRVEHTNVIMHKAIKLTPSCNKNDIVQASIEGVGVHSPSAEPPPCYLAYAAYDREMYPDPCV